MKRNTQNHVDAWWELCQVIRAWLAGEGDLAGLLIAWLELVSGRIIPGKVEF